MLQQSVTLKGLPRFQQPLSLRSSVSIVVAMLVFFTNLGMTLILLLFNPAPNSGTPTFRIQIAIWIVIMSGLTSLIVYIFARQLLSPLGKLNKQLLDLRERGNRLRAEDLEEEPSASEINVLRETLRELLEQISTEQERRDAFIATLVHDLKTPLVAIGHLLMVIEKDDQLSRDERVNLVNKLHIETDRLIDLVQKMVDAYKFERQSVQLNRIVYPLHALVATLLERSKPFAEQRNLTLTMSGQAEALIDPKELERALYNLLTNALRYARKEIHIEVTPQCVRIIDDGPGLPKPLKELSKPFNGQPADIAGQRYTTGTGGLGLFIAKCILEAHGGHLLDESANHKTILAAYFS